jgi:hypothetical protein
MGYRRPISEIQAGWSKSQFQVCVGDFEPELTFLVNNFPPGCSLPSITGKYICLVDLNSWYGGWTALKSGASDIPG